MTTPPELAAPAPFLSVSIGRDPTNDVVVDSSMTSGAHCRIEARPEGHTVIDLGSFAGTYVNGATVHERLLREGDLVSVADATFALQQGRLFPKDTRHLLLRADHVEYRLPEGRQILGPVSVDFPPGTLTAIVGPSGAGKSTLFRVLTGGLKPSTGNVTYGGADIHRQWSFVRNRIGIVPQDDVVHHALTVRQSMAYAADLRFPPDLPRALRLARVNASTSELQLTQQVSTKIGRLSGGQRKRVSVALELLTEPQILLLDEPTSGLDPGLDKAVMTSLREIADRGRTVAVITHATANLTLCDSVLVLVPSGRMAYWGPPGSMVGHFGSSDMAEIFSRLETEGPQLADTYARTSRPAIAPEPPVTSSARAAPDLEPEAPDQGPRAPMAHQVRTLIRRQIDLTLADRSFSLFTLGLPILLGMLSWAVPGESGLALPSRPSNEALQLLVILVIGCTFMGMSATIRDLVAERAIYRREKAVGLSPTAYLIAKVTVASGIAALQTIVLLSMVVIRKPLPDNPVLLGWGPLELWIALCVTTIAGAALGLMVSAWVSTSEQVMPILVVSVMAQMVLSGGMLPVTGRLVLAQLSTLAPARWGYAASATTAHVLDALGVPREDALWEPFATTWLFTLLILLFLTLGLLALTHHRLERT